MMHSTGSTLKAIVEKIRFLYQAEDGDAPSDTYIVQYLIASSYDRILTSMQMDDYNQVRVRTNISVVKGTSAYVLPPHLSQVLWIAAYDTNGHRSRLLNPISFMSDGEGGLPGGWSLEGNILYFSPAPAENLTITVVHTPSASVAPHYSESGTLNSTTSVTLDVSGSDDLGLLDRTENAYAGAVFRFLPTTGKQQIRIISAYDVDTATITLREPLVGVDSYLESSAVSGINYEISPPGSYSLISAIAYDCVLEWGRARGLPDTKLRNYEIGYRNALKAVKDRFTNMNAPRGRGVEIDTAYSAADNLAWWY